MRATPCRAAKPFLLRFAVAHQVGDVDLLERPGVGRGGQAADHVLGDRAAHRTELHDLFARAVDRVERAGQAGAGQALACAVAAPAPVSSAARTSSRVTRPPMPLPRIAVASMPCSAASLRTAGDRRARSPLPSPSAARAAAGLAATGAGAAERGAGAAGTSGCAAAGSFAGAAVASAAAPLEAVSIWAITAPDADGLALGDRDLDQLAFEGRRDLGVDLVGHHFHDGLVAFDEVTLALEPLLDRALGHRLAELGHLDLGQAHAPSPR